MKVFFILVIFYIFNCCTVNGFQDGYQDEEATVGTYSARENYFNNYPQPYHQSYSQPAPEQYLQPYPRSYYGNEMNHPEFDERGGIPSLWPSMPSFQRFPSLNPFKGSKGVNKVQPPPPSPQYIDPNAKPKKLKRTKKVKKISTKTTTSSPFDGEIKKIEPKSPTRCNCECLN